MVAVDDNELHHPRDNLLSISRVPGHDDQKVRAALQGSIASLEVA